MDKLVYMEHEINNFTILTGYFALILHFETLKYQHLCEFQSPNWEQTLSVKKANLFISRSFGM